MKSQSKGFVLFCSLLILGCNNDNERLKQANEQLSKANKVLQDANNALTEMSKTKDVIIILLVLVIVSVIGYYFIRGKIGDRYFKNKKE